MWVKIDNFLVISVTFLGKMHQACLLPCTAHDSNNYMHNCFCLLCSVCMFVCMCVVCVCVMDSAYLVKTCLHDVYNICSYFTFNMYRKRPTLFPLAMPAKTLHCFEVLGSAVA